MQATKTLAFRTTPIAGPRRAPRPSESTGHAESSRPARLASLDFEDVTARRSPPSLEATQPGHRARMQRIRWFAYGIVVGTVGAAMGGGGAESLCRAVHDCGGGAVDSRSNETTHRPPPLDLALAPGAESPPAVPTVRVDDLPPVAKDRGPDPRGSTRGP